MPPIGRFCFLRHGESESNVKGVVAGWQDVALTARGRAQAAEAAERLAGLGLTAVFASRLARARDTAEIVAARLGLGVTVVPDLAERNWGALEGRPSPRADYLAAPPGGESAAEFMRRTLAGLARAAPPGAGFPLVVAHAGTFRTIRDLFLAGDRAVPVTGRAPLIVTPGAAPPAAPWPGASWPGASWPGASWKIEPA